MLRTFLLPENAIDSGLWIGGIGGAILFMCVEKHSGWTAPRLYLTLATIMCGIAGACVSGKIVLVLPKRTPLGHSESLPEDRMPLGVMALLSVLILAVSFFMKYQMHALRVFDFYAILVYVTISLPFLRHRYLPLSFLFEMYTVGVIWLLAMLYIDNSALILRIGGRDNLVFGTIPPATMVVRLPLAAYLRFGFSPPGIRSSALISLVSIILLGVIGYTL